MAQPIVSFMDDTNTSVVANWDIGQIDANSTSPILKVLVWNNKGGAGDVSDMQDCSVTLLDGTGGDLAPIVTGKWMQAKVNGTGAFDPIGGATSKPIKAAGQTENLIKGLANTGVLADVANFSAVELKVVPPGVNAPAGRHDFRIRIQYFYT